MNRSDCLIEGILHGYYRDELRKKAGLYEQIEGTPETGKAWESEPTAPHEQNPEETKELGWLQKILNMAPRRKPSLYEQIEGTPETGKAWESEPTAPHEQNPEETK